MQWHLKTTGTQTFYESSDGEYRIMNTGKKGGEDYWLFIRGHHGMPKFKDTFCTHIFSGTLDECKGRVG